MTYLCDHPLDLGTLLAEPPHPRRGAKACFVGTVRNHHRGRRVVSLSYSAYGPMAEQVCGAIVAEAESRWPVSVSLRHRTGMVGIGEAAVVVVVAGDHRDEAFSACRALDKPRDIRNNISETLSEARLESRKRIVPDLSFYVSKRIKQARFSRIGEPNEPDICNKFNFNKKFCFFARFTRSPLMWRPVCRALERFIPATARATFQKKNSFAFL